jgi:hypothetical protein
LKRKVTSEKRLKSLLTILRANGVLRYKRGDIEIELAPAAMKLEADESPDISQDRSDPYAAFPTGVLSNEELAYWSAGGPAQEEK